jgi:acetyltransferase-like isoleucine patch superfamily enzyme
VTRPIEIGPGCQIGPFAVIYGGSVLGDGTRLEEHVILGKPEQGYAVGHTYPGSGAATVIGPGAVIRAGAILYAGTEVGGGTVVGHHTLLRSFVTVGADTQLGHNLTVERASRIGDRVRCSPGSHITSSCVLADRVFLGAGVRTVNDREMIWRDPGREPELIPPSFGHGARVGSGVTILAGVTIGDHALVGAGSVVTKDIPAGAVAYGVPARVRGRAQQGAS